MNQSKHLRNETWNTYRFDQIAQNVSERIEPADAETDIYVGLEHLDPESLHLRRWGTPADVEGTKLRFYQGDVIFGKRRAYQRKLAVAEFDGICSAHAMVLRARPDVALPEFLPFFLQSDMFFERALAISKGSLSPTINWSDLARQEFPLPPLDEQRRIAEILWAADEAVERVGTVSHMNTQLRNLTFETSLNDGLSSGSWQCVKLKELLFDCQYGSSTASGPRIDGSVPILRIPNVAGGYLDLTDLKWVKIDIGEFERYRLTRGDILLVRTNGNPNYVGRSIVIDEPLENSIFASYLIRLRVDESRLLPHYLNALLASDYLRRTLTHEIRSSAGNYNINSKGIARQEIPLPPLNDQQKIVDLQDRLSLEQSNIERHQILSRHLKAMLVNQLLMAH